MIDARTSATEELAAHGMTRRAPRRPFTWFASGTPNARQAAATPIPLARMRAADSPHNPPMSMPLQSHDAELMQLLDRVALQDAAAFKQLYELCSSKLYGLAIRVVDNRVWAEDVLQDAFLVIWRTAADYRASLSPPMAWMGLIVRSRGLDLMRRRASQRSHLTQDIDDDTMADTLANDTPSPMDTAQASEQAWALHQCLQKLENRQREVVSLSYMRDLSQSEMAAQLNLPLGTVKTWIRRGLEQLRSCMARFA